MTETVRIKDQLERAFSGDAWYGDSLMEILTDVSAEKAAARLFPNALSIWELVLHLTFTEEIMRRRIEGENVVIHESEDFPKPANTGENDWKSAIENLKSSHEKLKSAIDILGENVLNKTIEGWNYSRYLLLHGLIQHLVYHAGQIALLKKFLTVDNNSADTEI